MSDTPPRVPPLEPAEWTDEARAALQTVIGSRGDAYNIFKTFAHHPEALKAFLVWGNYILNGSALPAREREILILRIGWLARAEYEWAQHVRIGRDAGLTEAEIEAVKIGADDPSWSATDRLLIEAADQLHRQTAIEDATWAGLSDAFTTQQCMDIVFTVGQYTLVCMALKTFAVPLDPWLDTGF